MSAATLELLVATQDGVLRTDTTGLGTECVDNSQGASGESPGDLGEGGGSTCQLCPLALWACTMVTAECLVGHL